MFPNPFSVVGDLIEGNAKDKSAKAVLEFEHEALGNALSERYRNTERARELTAIQPQEFAAIQRLLVTREQQLTSTLQSIDKQQRTLDEFDPAIKAAGAELVGLLRGEASKVLAPVQAQQQRRRKELEDRLQQQIGPGWMTSSAGMQALARFEAESDVLMSQVQQNALQQAAGIFTGLSGTQMQGQQTVTQQTAAAFTNAAQMDQAILQAENTFATRQANAYLGALQASPINWRGPAQAVAGQYAGQEFMGQAFSAYGRDMNQAAATIAGALVGNAVGGGNSFAGVGAQAPNTSIQAPKANSAGNTFSTTAVG